MDATATDRVADASGWTDTTSFGLLLVAVTLLVSTAHLVVVGTFAGPVLVLPVIALVCGATGIAVRRGTRRGLIAALVVAVLVLLGNLGHLVDTLALPASPWDFVPNLAATVGIVTALAGAVAGLRRAAMSATTARRTRTSLLAVVGLGAVVSVALSLAGPAPLPDDAVVVATAANAYAPDEVEVAPGDVVGVRNDDAYGHTFTVVDLGIDVGVAGGATAVVPIDPATSTGSYEITCVLHPQIMVGTLTVTAP